MFWDHASDEWKRLAIHESGHGSLCELLGWRVESIHITPDIGGEVRTLDTAPVPWVEIAVGAAGHAAEAALCGGLGELSYSDRQRVSVAFETAGADPFSNAAENVEGGTALLVATTPRLRRLVLAVARGLVENGGRLDRHEFRRIGARAGLFNEDFRTSVRRSCRQIVHEVLQDAMEHD